MAPKCSLEAPLSSPSRWYRLFIAQQLIPAAFQTPPRSTFATRTQNAAESHLPQNRDAPQLHLLFTQHRAIEPPAQLPISSGNAPTGHQQRLLPAASPSRPHCPNGRCPGPARRSTPKTPRIQQGCRREELVHLEEILCSAVRGQLPAHRLQYTFLKPSNGT